MIISLFLCSFWSEFYRNGDPRSWTIFFEWCFLCAGAERKSLWARGFYLHGAIWMFGGVVRCTQHYCWCTQLFKWMGENAFHLKYKTCTPNTPVFTRSVHSSSLHHLLVFTTMLELLLLPVQFAFLGGSFATHWVVCCRHWGPATPFCSSTVEVSFASALMAAFSYFVLCVWWINLIYMPQLHPYESYGSTWFVWLIWINFIRMSHIDQLDP